MKIIGIIIGILGFFFLIVTHEFGHFALAKAFNVKVLEFSVGMGPLLWQKKRGETDYSLRAIPIGGYCMMEGEDEESEDPRAFINQGFWPKFCILIAGSAVNLITGFLILCLAFSQLGYIVTTLDCVMEGGPAEAAGIMAGDKIVSIDGVQTPEWTDVTEAIDEGTGETVLVGVERDGEILYFETGYTYSDGRRIIGITASYSKSTTKAFSQSVTACKEMYTSTLEFLAGLFNGKSDVDDVSGVVGLAAVVVDTAQYGIINVIYLVGMLGVNLSVMNMLPIPGLDGGRIMVMLVKVISGGRLSKKAEGIINGVGTALLFALMAFLIVKDTISLIR